MCPPPPPRLWSTTTTDSEWLGKAPWEVPIGRVIYGMEDVIDKLYRVGEIHPFDDKGVKQGKIWKEGNEYLHREFPKVGWAPDERCVGPIWLLAFGFGCWIHHGADVRMHDFL